jgi:hypothetical protein
VDGDGDPRKVGRAVNEKEDYEWRRLSERVRIARELRLLGDKLERGLSSPLELFDLASAVQRGQYSPEEQQRLAEERRERAKP